MGVLSWIFFGAIAGWAANVVVGGKDRRPQGCLVSVLVGVVGAALGGLGYQLITGQEIGFQFNFASLGVAILGAIVLLVLIRLVSGRRH
ncbi:MULTISPECIES: GlsB/YeaQ/YmgE family stress response membrane protein [Actinoalloteichus]|uniref:Membrane protein n=1 Tax=Actinoalloteichus fjordicus TaxID=1612552 RepID=A0AAC9LH59_9PSEU|nr:MULTISPECIES: GlsB/YeaQ/YmgE family stress response membrane protein [Actinoalloteichus]APU17713.1 putative membrane protein [Actinoalloteichus fjordicus]APU23791.1 putative membrane protein [Actinoalloteichus sp. GBA129-24]